MVRMFGIRAISLSRLCDNGIRLTHSPESGAKLPVNDRGVSTSGSAGMGHPAQPALAASQEYGSTSPPLIQTSKWRWFAVERPVLPTKPINWPAATVCPACT